jgi:hypothetical protein
MVADWHPARPRWEKLALLLALVSRWKVRQANVPMRGVHYTVRAALCITFMYALFKFTLKINNQI